MRRKSVLHLAASIAAFAAPGSAMAQSAGITAAADIDGFPRPSLGSSFGDISGDGSTVAATVRSDATTFRAYRVTSAGYEELPGLPDHSYVLANGVSDNGSVVVGVSQSTFSSRGTAMQWDGTTATELGHLATSSGSQNSVAYGISGDGRVAVGASVPDGIGLHAVRWVDKGAAQDLHGGGFVSSDARRANRDGSVIVGRGATSARTSEAFVWTEGGGMTALGVLASQAADSGARSFAEDVSADGAVVVGFSQATNGNSEAFRWTSAGGMTSLGLLPGGNSSGALGVNADGSVIVGSARRPSAFVPSIQDTVAFRWTSSGGLQPVADWLAANGVAVGSNSFTDAVAVSDDGNVIIGTGQINGTTQQYIARIAGSTGGGGGTDGGTDGGTGGGTDGGTDGGTGGGTDSGTDGGTGGGTDGGTDGGTGGGTDGGTDGGTGVIGLVDYLYSVADSGITLQTIINAASMTLFGAHHRPLMDFPQAGRNCGWITGDIAGSGRGDRRNYSGEVGICRDLGTGIRVGFGGGVDRTETQLNLGGKTETDGWHLVGEVDFQPQGTPLLLSVTGYYADLDVDVDRAYRNGTAIDISRARTHARAWALRGRLDWRDLIAFGGGASLTPYVAYSYAKVKMDGFTETGGGFPVIMADTRSDYDELRLGGRAGIPLGGKARLQLSGEWVHRFKTDPAALSGSIIGVGAFAVAAPTQRSDWGRAGTDLDFGIGKSALLSLSAHAMVGQGEDARLGGSVSFRFAF